MATVARLARWVATTAAATATRPATRIARRAMTSAANTSTRVPPGHLLADACRCPACWVADTHQRRAWQVPAAAEVPPASTRVHAPSGDLSVAWHAAAGLGADASHHETSFSAPWLAWQQQRWRDCRDAGVPGAATGRQQGQGRRHWVAPSLAHDLGTRVAWGADVKLPTVEFADLQVEADPGAGPPSPPPPAAADARRRLLQGLWTYGACLVRDAPRFQPGVTEAVGAVVGPPRGTKIYGRDFHVRVDGGDNDSSYTGAAIGAHADGAYFPHPPGLQLLHCWHADDTGGGGQSLLLDGMAVAEEMRRLHPGAWQLLCDTPLEYEFRDGRDWLVARHPVFAYDTDGSFARIVFNNHDRRPLLEAGSVPPQHAGAVYDALAALSSVLAAPRQQAWFTLRPGDVLIMHNHRVLHGRSEFSGASRRHLYGFYLDDADLGSQLRMARRSAAPSTAASQR